MKKLALFFALVALAPALFAKEVPGKSVLFPNNEIQEINYDIGGKADLQVARGLYKVKLNEGRTSHIVSFKFSDIEEMSVVQQLPQLRGRLIDVYDDEDKAFLSKTFLRLKFKKSLMGVDDLYLSLDFQISKKQQSIILEEDIRKLNEMALKALPVAITQKGIFTRLKKYKKTFNQFPLDLNEEEKVEFLTVYFEKLKAAIEMPFHSETNNSSLVLFKALDSVLTRSRGEQQVFGRNRGLHRRLRDDSRYNRLRAEERLKNAWLLESNLKVRGLNVRMTDWRARRLDDEFCFRANYPVVSICPKSIQYLPDFKSTGAKPSEYSYYQERLVALRSYTERSISLLQSLVRSRLKKDPDYIHNGMQEKLDDALDKLIFADNELLRMADFLKKNDIDERLDLENTIIRFRTVIWSSFLKTLLENGDYDEIRFYDEGGFYHNYPRFFVKDSVSSIRKMIKSLQPFNWALEGLEELGTFLSSQNLLTQEEAEEIQKDFIQTDLERLGTSMGEGVVNVLGQIFKKRKWVPYIRVATMFRPSHLTERREYVFKNLFAKDGMKPGDIILEKDLKANTDVLIPGYWVHASIYIGTIKDLKAMGIWDHPDFSIIQYEIEKYRTSKDRQHYLNVEWKNKLPFDEVPWFYESDRTGVAVHPLQKFLYTDGMAVLRPNGAWGKKEIFDVYKRANERMYFPYDYVHNTRNKFYVSCSKVVLKVFNNVTFPVSKNLNYISVSPDQIGQAVSMKEKDKDEGELKLLMFFDAFDKGEIKYHYNRPETYSNYDMYIKASGLK